VPRSRSAAAASEPLVAQVARAALAKGNAVDAVVAGVLAAAAAAPGVLLGPLQMLVAGTGAGRVAVDGRLRQPGLGLPRPRGARSAGELPPSAAVACPAMPATLATVLAAHGTATMRRLAGPALKLARSRSSPRAAVLDALSRRGAPALTDGAIAAELLAVAGRAAGGSLTIEDLGAVRPGLERIEEATLEPAGWVRVPWSAPGADASDIHVVAAADGRGTICIACYEVATEGVSFHGLGLLAPARAAPVLHGEPRVKPGAPLPAQAPIAIRAPAGGAGLAVGIAQVAKAHQPLDRLIEALADSPLAADAIARAEGRAVVVSRDRDGAAVLASA
jgi:gamma-glutamyltranspeptidase/glutathione hydrolase